jgi:hypothetical protein
VHHHPVRLVTLLVVILAALTLHALPAFAVDPCDDPNPPPTCDVEPTPPPPPTQPDWWIADVRLSGPTQLAVYASSYSDGWSNYAIDVTIGRRAGFTGFVNYTGPFWLWERDGALHPQGDFMSFQRNVYFAPGQSTIRIFLQLRCSKEVQETYAQVEGRDWLDERGYYNNRRSGEGEAVPVFGIPDPAEVNVSVGPRGQPNDRSNELSVSCYYTPAS